MARLSPILRSVVSGDGARRLAFWCPGCDGCHVLRVLVEGGPHPAWGFNENVNAPTFTPSILVTADFSKEDGGPDICHSYVTDGRIHFLDDCTHALAGQTVNLPAWDFEYGGTEE